MLVTAGLWMAGTPEHSPEDDRELLRQLVLKNDDDAAQPVAQRYLQHRPDDHEVRQIAAQIALRRDDPELAVEHLDQIPLTGTPQDIEVLLLRANVHLDYLHQLQTAASCFEQVLKLQPNHVETLRQLARLYAVCGRRRDALPLILNLVRQNAASDLLLVAARPSGAINDEPLLRQAYRKHPHDAFALTGLAMLAARLEQLPQAIRYCQQALKDHPNDAAAVVLLGETLLQRQDFSALEAWQSRLNGTHEQYAEVWRVRGYIAEQAGRRQQALTQFLQAAKLGPDLKDVHHRIAQLLFAGDYTDAAELFTARLQQLQQLEAAQDRVLAGDATEADLMDLVERFRQVGRLWEAFGWCQLTQQNFPASRPVARRLQQLRTQATGQPLDLVPITETLAARFSAGDFSLADAKSSRVDRSHEPPLPAESAVVQFRNDAGSAGFCFAYENGVPGPTQHLMFELTGGGIGVADFDCDGDPDLFCSQGSLWSERGTAAAPTDQLFFNRQGKRYIVADETAGLQESGFGQGVAIGDVNEDGFADIVVANFGAPELWLNNGDGTFVADPAWRAAAESRSAWWTSVLIADLDGRSGPDVYLTGYLSGQDVDSRTCSGSSGQVQSCPPTIFDGVANLLLANTGDATFRDQSDRVMGDETGKSLGVLAWSPDSNGRLSVFVANDTTPNHVFSLTDTNTATDTGFARGLATNASGKAEGCMGIAVADLDFDGRSELFVTNFLNESNTLYEPVTAEFFQDATDRWQLAEVSRPVLGFGTQFLDSNLDGVPELFVANGHVDDLRSQGKPYHMPAQVFALTGRQFEDRSGQQKDEYFHKDHLGRAVARLDWNLDGRPDLAVGHLMEDYALLTSVGEPAGRFLQIRLVGRSSSRDAVGATVVCRIGDRQLVQQVTAGDGYHCSNERVLSFGCGQRAEVSDLTVIWPDGGRQTLGPVSTDARYVVQQDRRLPFRVPR